jgi:hypothetical protein
MKELEATEPLVKVHVDVVGPIDTVGYQGGRYFMTVVDEYSGYSVEGVFKDEAEIRVGLEECLAKWEVAARKMVKGVNPAAAGTSVHRAASQQIAQGGGGAQAAAVGSMGGEESGEGDSAEGEGGENPAAAVPAPAPLRRSSRERAAPSRPDMLAHGARHGQYDQAHLAGDFAWTNL